MDEDKLLESKLNDLARGAAYGRGARFSRFLEPPGLLAARRAARALDVPFRAEGGYPDAERAVAAFGDEDTPAPVACVRASWDARYGSVAHRDVLGAEMALGLSRDMLGDIVMADTRAYLFVHEDALRYVLDNLSGAGRVRLRLEAVAGPVELPEPKGRSVRETVASARLDALVAAAWNVSRQDAQQLIARELVKVNFVSETRPDKALAASDLVSARGYGRFRLLEEPEPTRKGRLAVRLFLYGA